MTYSQEEAFLSYLLFLTMALFLSSALSLAFFRERFAAPLALAGLVCLVCIWICEFTWAMEH